MDTDQLTWPKSIYPPTGALLMAVLVPEPYIAVYDYDRMQRRRYRHPTPSSKWRVNFLLEKYEAALHFENTSGDVAILEARVRA